MTLILPGSAGDAWIDWLEVAGLSGEQGLFQERESRILAYASLPPRPIAILITLVGYLVISNMSKIRRLLRSSKLTTLPR